MSKEDDKPKGTDTMSDASSGNVPTLTTRSSTGQPGGKKDDQRFWRALQKDDAPAAACADEPEKDLAGANADADEDVAKQKQRLHALRSMLAASEARQQHVLQRRLPALSTGVRIGVRSGPYKDHIGTVKDADFIHNRVLLELDNEDEPQWISFQRLAPIVTN